jgi:hypothetical protein
MTYFTAPVNILGTSGDICKLSTMDYYAGKNTFEIIVSNGNVADLSLRNIFHQGSFINDVTQYLITLFVTKALVLSSQNP